jgi:tRNA/rRNA methyltransferase
MEGGRILVQIPVRIVLVEPAGARNLGSIARVMKNMGLRQWVLVNPSCDPLSAEARHMAVHAAELLESAMVVSDLATALQGCHRVVATIGRESARPVESLRSVIPWVLGQDQANGLASSLQAAIVFGREDHGLNNAELQQAQRLVTIPSHPDYASLNLAQAVGICCYELFQALDAKMLPPPAVPATLPALSEDLQAFYEQLEQLFLQIGYLYPHTAFSRMEKFRITLNRAQPSAEEVRMLRGILRQANWALSQERFESENLSKFSEKSENKSF